MKNHCCAFTRVQLLLLTGISWLVAVTVTTVNSSRIGGYEAFVGTLTSSRRHNAPSLVELERNGQSRRLYGVQGTTESFLLEGKLMVLQDVVRELEARHQRLRAQSDTAEREYHQRLEVIERDLEESKHDLEAHESTVADLQRDLEETRSKHISDLEVLEARQQQTREGDEDSQQRSIQQHQHDLEALRKELRNHYKGLVDELSVELELKDIEAEGISARLLEIEQEASRSREENDGIIEELKEQLEKSQQGQTLTQIDSSSGKTPSEPEEDLRQKKEQRDHDESEAREKLKIGIRDATATMETDHRLKLRGLEEDHQRIVDDLNSTIESLRQDNERGKSILKTTVSSCEEQVQIATAAVTAGEIREKSLRKESDRLTKEIKRHWLLARLANLASERLEEEQKSLSRENRELWSENEDLRDELETVRGGIADLLREQETAKQRSVLQKLRSRFSKQR